MFGTKHGTFWFIQLSIQYKGDNTIKKDRFKTAGTLGNIATEYKACKRLSCDHNREVTSCKMKNISK